MRKILQFYLFVILISMVYSKETIIILNSYGEDFQWTSDEVDGILSGFGNSKEKYDFYIEYMDWKKEFGKNKFNLLKEIYIKKYSGIEPIMIITTDNIAYTMAKQLRIELFKNENIPLIFCGINGIKEFFIYDEKNIAGIAETLSIEDNINLILSLHKDLEKIYIINDESETGIETKEEIQKLKYLQKSIVKIEYINMNSISDFKSKILNIEKNSVIIQGISTMYNDGTYTSYENTLKIIIENSNVPVYSLWTFLMNKGIMGGKLLDGKENGKMTGEIAVKILNGELPSKIGIIEKDVNKYYFDNKLLLKYKINPKKIIKDAVIINENPSLFKENKIKIIFSLSVITTLLFIFIIHSFIIRIYKN